MLAGVDQLSGGCQPGRPSRRRAVTSSLSVPARSIKQHPTAAACAPVCGLFVGQTLGNSSETRGWSDSLASVSLRGPMILVISRPPGDGARWGSSEVVGQQFARVRDRIVVRVEVQLRRRQRPVTGNLAQVVNRYARVRTVRPVCRRSCQTNFSRPSSTRTSSHCVASRRTAVGMRPLPRGPLNGLAIGSSPACWMSRSIGGRTSLIRGTTRVPLPFVPLSSRPPGDGVVWRRKIHSQRLVSMLPR